MGKGVVQMAAAPAMHIADAVQHVRNGDYAKAVGSVLKSLTSDPADTIADQQLQSSALATKNMMQAAKQGDALAVAQHAAGIVPGASQVDAAMTNYQNKPSRENLIHVITTAASILIPEGIKAGANILAPVEEAATEAFRARVTPTIKETPRGAQIPVRSDTAAGRIMAAGAPDKAAEFAQTRTAPAVQQALGGTVGEAIGSEGTTNVTAEDRFGVKGHAANVIKEQAVPAFKRLDELSDNKFTDAQNKVASGWATRDMEKVNEGQKAKSAIIDQYRDQLNSEGLDPDTAEAAYGRGKAAERMAKRLDVATGPSDVEGAPFEVNGKRLAKVVDDGIKNGAWKRMGLTDEHITELQSLAKTMAEQGEAPKVSFITKNLGRLAVAAVGLHSGMFPAVEALTGMSAAEHISSKIAGKVMQDAMLDFDSTRALNDSIKSGDARPVVDALSKDPSWASRMGAYVRDTVKDLIKNRPFQQGGETGAIGAKVKARFSGGERNDLKAIGMSDEDIEKLQGYSSAPTEVETENNASGGNPTSLEAVRRLASQRGEQHFRVDSRMANSPDAWKPIPATVDRVDMHPGPNEHIVTMKDGEITNTKSGENARPLPTNEQIKKMVSNTSVLTRDGANALLNKLNVEGLKAVGSVATGGKSLHDLDLLAPSKESAAEAREKLEAQGFEWMGSGGVSPKEAARYGEGKPYGDKDLWSVADKYEHKDTGEKLEVWHKEPGEKDDR
jgi:hypothetical protein